MVTDAATATSGRRNKRSLGISAADRARKDVRSKDNSGASGGKNTGSCDTQSGRVVPADSRYCTTSESSVQKSAILGIA